MSEGEQEGVTVMSNCVYTVDELKMRMIPIFVNYGIKRAVLFGSYSKGNASTESDIDLLVDSGLRGLRFVGFIEELRSSLDKDMDVFDVTHLKEGTIIDSEIKKTGVVLYEE